LEARSDADKMVLPKETEQHMEMLKKHDIEVESLNFKTSRHVEHMRAFPQEYSAALEKFLKRVADVPETNKPQGPIM
jgi:dipeptidyl aminopeptidase/acylaminoacyl peptidase